jgi:maltose-binding protein MalE
MGSDPALKANPLVQSFSSQVPNSRLYLPTVKEFNYINANIFQPAIQQAERSGGTATVLKAASAQLNTLLGCQ